VEGLRGLKWKMRAGLIIIFVGRWIMKNILYFRKLIDWFFILES
jgi:hypothetical protein